MEDFTGNPEDFTGNPREATERRKAIPDRLGFLEDQLCGCYKQLDADRFRLDSLEQWQTVFTELVARISVLEGVVLKLTLGEDQEDLLPAFWRCGPCGIQILEGHDCPECASSESGSGVPK